MEAQPGSLAVFGTAHITQFFPSRLLEPFDAYSVEVREHREHSNMELLETKSCIDVDDVAYALVRAAFTLL
jgi:hypothetical protein